MSQVARHLGNTAMGAEAALPSFGIAEVMAQSLRLCWPRQEVGSFLVAEAHELALPPRFISGTGGSAIFAAMESVAPVLAIDNLADLTQQARLVILFVGSDLAYG